MGRERVPPLRQSVSEASRKIESIIDAAEKAAIEIREEAAAEAASYRKERLAALEEELEARRAAHGGRELDKTARELGELVGPLVAWADALREAANHAAERLHAIAAELADEEPGGIGPPTKSPAPPLVEPERPRPPVAPVPAPEPPARPEVSPLPSEAGVRSPGAIQVASGPQPVAYPGQGTASATSTPPGREDARSRAEGAGSKAEAVLLATQLAVSGAARSDIEAKLKSTLELEDVKPMLDELLGPELHAG